MTTLTILKRRIVCLLFAGLVATFCGFASAQPVLTPVETTFDQSLEGWTLKPGQIATIAHVAVVGNPGGCLRMTAGGNGRTDVLAPAEYLGDWSALDEVGVLTFDHQIFELGASPIGPPYYPYEVVLRGGGNVARYFLTI